MTHTAKHTPGPWVTDNYFDITSLRGDVIVRPPLSALEKARMHPGERQANAHLIAAAPAMYEALQALVEVFPSVVKMTPYGVPMSISKIHDNAVAALAQAEGKHV